MIHDLRCCHQLGGAGYQYELLVFLVENNQLLARTVHEFSGITVNNREKDRFWIGFRGLILVDRSFMLLILCVDFKLI